MEAPERIWTDGYGIGYRLSPSHRYPDSTEYVRADLYAKLAAELDFAQRARSVAVTMIADEHKAAVSFKADNARLAAENERLRQRVLDEREACAKVADDLTWTPAPSATQSRAATIRAVTGHWGGRIARTIRARAALTGGSDGE